MRTEITREVAVAGLGSALGFSAFVSNEATASNGAGVFETLKASARQVLTELRRK